MAVVQNLAELQKLSPMRRGLKCTEEKSEAQTACKASETIVSADAKLTQGRRLKTDPPRRGVLRTGGPHAGGGGSGGDPGLETAGQKHSRDRANARRVAQHGTSLSTTRRAAAVSA